MKILVNGGAGYIGCVLVPSLLARGHEVTVFDCLLFGEEPLARMFNHPRFRLVQGDIRRPDAVRKILADGFDAVIHLAAISNDPSSNLNPDLTRAVNYAATEDVMRASKAAGVARFVFASSASVYGIKETEHVTEDLPFDPLTIYAASKVYGEHVLAELTDQTFCGVSIRAGTVCGFSPRLRLDLTINILTSHALTGGRIRVFGGTQMRPNIHIQDLADFYVRLVEAEADEVRGEAFNISHDNATVMALAEMIAQTLGGNIPIDTVPTDDTRSYHLSAEKASSKLGFSARRPLKLAVEELRQALSDGRVQDVADTQYRNVHHMKANPDFWILS